LIQRLLKGKDVRVKMGLAKKAASKIQGWIKSIWLRSMIQQIKRAIIIIQVILPFITRDNIELIMNVRMKLISKKRNMLRDRAFS